MPTVPSHSVLLIAVQEHLPKPGEILPASGDGSFVLSDHQLIGGEFRLQCFHLDLSRGNRLLTLLSARLKVFLHATNSGLLSVRRYRYSWKDDIL